MGQVHVYSVGLISCSVCAPKEMTPEEVAAAVNAEQPTGISSDWQLSADPAFAQGMPNPGPCDQEPDARIHYLMNC